jgi:integrase
VSLRCGDADVDCGRYGSARAIQVSISRGEWLDPADGKVRVGDWAGQWLAGRVQLKPSTFARYELILRKQVLPTWERLPLSKVTFADVGVWVQELSASHLSAASVRQAHQLGVACAPHDTLVRVLAYTGIRWGEAAALRVGRVDLERRRLSIDEALGGPWRSHLRHPQDPQAPRCPLPRVPDRTTHRADGWTWT